MLRRVLRLARMLCALMYRQNGDLANLLKSARKKSAPECPFECGGGGSNRYLGNAQIEVTLTSKVLPLTFDIKLKKLGDVYKRQLF